MLIDYTYIRFNAIININVLIYLNNPFLVISYTQTYRVEYNCKSSGGSRLKNNIVQFELLGGTFLMQGILRYFHVAVIR